MDDVVFLKGRPYAHCLDDDEHEMLLAPPYFCYRCQSVVFQVGDKEHWRVVQIEVEFCLASWVPLTTLPVPLGATTPTTPRSI